YSLGLNLYKKDYEYIDYTQDQLGGTLMLGRQFLRNFHASVGVGYVDNQSEFADNNDSLYPSYLDDVYKDLYNDKYKKSSVFFSLSYDNTDDFYTPREGMVAAVTTELASLDGEDVNLTRYPEGYGNFVKTTGKVGFYYGLEDWIDYDMILRLKGRMSTISTGDGEKLPTAEKLFLGGIGSVRGYNPYSISPLYDPNDPYSRRIGGKYSASSSVEASIPLSEAAKMRLAFFYDYGMIGEDSFDEIKRSSTGAVIEWQSMFGPINLVFAKALDDEPGDETASFEFSMGSKF
ncbi:MAG: outer membrane protein insertion porin family, partial [Campylobacterota bacterium]|nr:outer membrane protein insertion porin family [Campylobacterota bacterium]